MVLQKTFSNHQNIDYHIYLHKKKLLLLFESIYHVLRRPLNTPKDKNLEMGMKIQTNGHVEHHNHGVNKTLPFLTFPYRVLL